MKRRIAKTAKPLIIDPCDSKSSVACQKCEKAPTGKAQCCALCKKAHWRCKRAAEDDSKLCAQHHKKHNEIYFRYKALEKALVVYLAKIIPSHPDAFTEIIFGNFAVLVEELPRSTYSNLINRIEQVQALRGRSRDFFYLAEDGCRDTGHTSVLLNYSRFIVALNDLRQRSTLSSDYVEKPEEFNEPNDYGGDSSEHNSTNSEDDSDDGASEDGVNDAVKSKIKTKIKNKNRKKKKTRQSRPLTAEEKEQDFKDFTAALADTAVKTNPTASVFATTATTVTTAAANKANTIGAADIANKTEKEEAEEKKKKLFYVPVISAFQQSNLPAIDFKPRQFSTLVDFPPIVMGLAVLPLTTWNVYIDTNQTRLEITIPTSKAEEDGLRYMTGAMRSITHENDPGLKVLGERAERAIAAATAATTAAAATAVSTSDTLTADIILDYLFRVSNAAMLGIKFDSTLPSSDSKSTVVDYLKLSPVKAYVNAAIERYSVLVSTTARKKELRGSLITTALIIYDQLIHNPIIVADTSTASSSFADSKTTTATETIKSIKKNKINSKVVSKSLIVPRRSELPDTVFVNKQLTDILFPLQMNIANLVFLSYAQKLQAIAEFELSFSAAAIRERLRQKK